MERRTVEVVLQGRRFVLRTGAEGNDLDEVVAFAESRLDATAQAANGMGPHPVALLALLGVCEELLRERRRMDGLRDKIRSKSSRILEMLEGVPRADDGNNPPAGGMSISVATEHGTP
jgi:hypothetical protein